MNKILLVTCFFCTHLLGAESLQESPGDSSLIRETLTPAYDLRLISRESFDNPLVQIETTLGSMILELFPREAPRTVANFIALAEGSKTFTDPETGQSVMRPLYDGTLFHRVIDGFMIQGGSPDGQGDGNLGFTVRDEINALSLGLDKMPLIEPGGTPHPVLGIRSEQDFRQRVLVPLYKAMGINSEAELEARIEEVDQRIRTLTVKEFYEIVGYRYVETVISRAPVRGVIAMANSGPDGNGSQFFITLADTPWLAGRYTVFGKVRAGMEVLDRIGRARVNADNRPYIPVRILKVRQLAD